MVGGPVSAPLLPWWRHQMKTTSALVAFCAGNSSVTGKKATDKLWCFFDLRLNRQLSKQCRHWWYETLPRSLWCHCSASLCHQFFDERIYLQYIQPRTRQIDIFSTRIIIKTTSLGILFNQNPRRHSKQKPWVRWTKGFCLGDLWGGSGWTEYRPSVFFYFHPVFFIFMGNYSCFQIAIYLRFFTSSLLCLNVHLNCLSRDNHLVPKQPQW